MSQDQAQSQNNRSHADSLPEYSSAPESSNISKSSNKVKMQSPILRKIDDTGRYAEITFIDGRNYALHHPGNRKAAEWKSISLTDKISTIDLMERAFEFVVKPINHNFQPNVDDIHPKELEVWTLVVQRFLAGKLEQEI
ncbi:MAG: hypothetical protein GW938_15610 [Leptospira sp.]|nr:hypothetical protein [Leptospira sp.]